MTATGPEHIGSNIALRRKAKGLTQHAFAARIGISPSMLTKVERGEREASHSTVAAAARALRCTIEDLTGQPYVDNKRDKAVHADIDVLRGVLHRVDLPSDITPRDIDVMAADVSSIEKLRRDAEYRKLAARLPALIEELSAAVLLAPDAQAPRLHSLLVSVYRATHVLVHRLGFPDLAHAVEHLLAKTAAKTGDPLAGALSEWVRAQHFQDVGEYGHGLTLMAGALRDLGPELRSPNAATLTVAGSLHLRAVTLAARNKDQDATREHLSAARDLARSLSTDEVHYGLVFGNSNIATHETGAFVEFQDSAAALEAAQRWRPSRAMPKRRQGHHFIDLARAYHMHGDRKNALKSLQEARRIAPQQTRLHPMVRQTAALLVHDHRRSNPDLTNFAGWLGLTA
ncbi:helix-turn-helix domain-containing protein [Saccharopolyspora spinosa]|uniref:Transcriptional regulator with XRE-family HTH domain n=1 Tax=Saccharopolyspora spinosa TaxID=60894 RepID=A0A2N3XXL6_SACSN|nr:helix-turn-helix transcriptional regulator [Saccharopolyspora spinosa]PKW15407.1 transcriptional regulator with XRE-family HTH domain [Saccharopolyspora spinosa]